MNRHIAYFSFLLLIQTSTSLAQNDSALRCQTLINLSLTDTTMSSAEVVTANSFSAPNSNNVMSMPAFCRVVGVTTPAVNFEVWLPMENWNGKYNGVGNGGMAGSISYGAMAGALRR
ncbi:uncharacterized protein METZ01_LOCUS411333, partial [marine metagenome]